MAEMEDYEPLDCELGTKALNLVSEIRNVSIQSLTDSLINSNLNTAVREKTKGKIFIPSKLCKFKEKKIHSGE